MSAKNEQGYTNVVSASNYIDLDFERWKLDRLSGDYIILEFTSKEPTDTLKSFSSKLGMNYWMTEPHKAIAKGETSYMTLKVSRFILHVNKIHEGRARLLLRDVIPADLEATINWWYITQNGPNSKELPLTGHTPHQAFYPWMTKSIDQFADEFVKSSANVLLLIGNPGTGKTSFIRGLIRRMKYETWVTYDKKVQENEQFYVRFAEPSDDQTKVSDGRCLVMEDADEMIQKRENGNELMNRVLNLSDGIVTLPARKIIFSTNLPGLMHVDEALLRPGRCFAAVKFRKLSYAEAGKACEAIGTTLHAEPDTNGITLSQALNGNQEMLEMQTIGFT